MTNRTVNGPTNTPTYLTNADLLVRRFGATGSLAALTTLTLGRLFVVAGALDVARQPFALAKSFETSEQLLNRLVTAWFDLNHVFGSSFKKRC